MGCLKIFWVKGKKPLRVKPGLSYNSPDITRLPDILVCHGVHGPHGDQVLVSRSDHKTLRKKKNISFWFWIHICFWKFGSKFLKNVLKKAKGKYSCTSIWLLSWFFSKISRKKKMSVIYQVGSGTGFFFVRNELGFFFRVGSESGFFSRIWIQDSFYVCLNIGKVERKTSWENVLSWISFQVRKSKSF